MKNYVEALKYYDLKLYRYILLTFMLAGTLGPLRLTFSRFIPREKS